MRRSRKGWRAPAYVVRETRYGLDGPGVAQQAMLDVQLVGHELDGRMGTPHFGMRGTPALTYSGWVASPQSFRGAAQLGSIQTPPWAPEQALPNASAPQAVPAWVEDWSSMEGIVP